MTDSDRTVVSGWGASMPVASNVRRPHDVDELAKALLDPGRRGIIARGLGRAYGDAAQNAGGVVIDTTGTEPDRIEIVDDTITVPAGTSLEAIMLAVVPKGRFVPVSPGTKFVTVGGAIAADVHGKNHHRDGSFANHVTSMRLALPTGDILDVTPDGEHADLFWATAGGMGLTGVILEATVRLPRIETSLITVDTDRLPDLESVMAAMEEGDEGYHYSVAWIDLTAKGRSMGRSVLTRGDFAPLDALPARKRANPLLPPPTTQIPAPPAPSGLLNMLTVRMFNEFWYRRFPTRRRGELQSITEFWHPLDIVDRWNRLYGHRGFLQWQPVIPFGEEQTLVRVVEALVNHGAASFLSVLKRFGPGNRGLLSFPQPGWTLALDIPVSHGAALGDLLDQLDRQVVEAGGRIYLAKDSRMRPEVLPLMYPQLDEFRAVRRRVDPDGVLVSDLARRLDLV